MPRGNPVGGGDAAAGGGAAGRRGQSVIPRHLVRQAATGAGAVYRARRRARTAAAVGRRTLFPALLLDCMGLRTRPLGPLGRHVGGRPPGLFSDLRLSCLGDPAGGGFPDAGAAPGGGVAGVPAASAVVRRAGRGGVRDQSQGSAGAGGMRVVGARMATGGRVCRCDSGGLGMDVGYGIAGGVLGRGLAVGAESTRGRRSWRRR